ncbi:hypothetical protein BJH93_04115 [Kocuria polaris]|nr:hypothetical protein [Kocuria polaris]
MAEQKKTDGEKKTPAAENTAQATPPTAADPAAPADKKADARPATRSSGRRRPKERVETFEATRPDGKKVKVTRNIETGKSSAEVVG